MARKPDRKIRAEVIMEGVDAFIPLVDTDEGKYATNAINAFEEHRLIKTKITDHGETRDVIANPDKVVAIIYQPTTEMVEYTDEVCEKAKM